MKLSELQNKDIISLDGKLIGNIIDVNIIDGKIISLVVEKSKFFFSFFSQNSLEEIKWEQIKTIGDDVIIIE